MADRHRTKDGVNERQLPLFIGEVLYDRKLVGCRTAGHRSGEGKADVEPAANAMSAYL